MMMNKGRITAGYRHNVKNTYSKLGNQIKKLLIILAVLSLAAPAMAAELNISALGTNWKFYGSARFSTFYRDVDPGIQGVDSDSDLVWAEQSNSRIGATVKLNDQIGGGFEYGAKGSIAERMLYGTYNFGTGELTIGQSYSPSVAFYSNSVYGGDKELLGIGQFYLIPRPMIQAKFGKFKIALLEPSTITKNATKDIDTTIPMVETSYQIKTGMFFLDMFAGYNTFTDQGGAGNGNDDIDYESYVIGIGGGITFAPMFLKAGFHIGQNFGNYDAYNQAGIADQVVVVNNKVVDCDGLGYLVVLGFKASEMFTIEAGFGYEQSKLDISNSDSDKVMQYYLNTTINIARGFFIVPEVGMRQRFPPGDNVSEPKVKYIGAKWQINF